MSANNSCDNPDVITQSDNSDFDASEAVTLESLLTQSDQDSDQGEFAEDVCPDDSWSHQYPFTNSLDYCSDSQAHRLFRYFSVGVFLSAKQYQIINHSFFKTRQNSCKITADQSKVAWRRKVPQRQSKTQKTRTEARLRDSRPKFRNAKAKQKNSSPEMRKGKRKATVVVC